MAFWPSGETTQSMNFCAVGLLDVRVLGRVDQDHAVLVEQLLVAFDHDARSPRFLNDSQVPRSARM
jgi:hypothetical protein